MPRPLSSATKTNAEKSRNAAKSEQAIVSPAKANAEPKRPATLVEASRVAITEDEFRARIAAKAYNLYADRLARTETDDWMDAERLVKEELLAEGHQAGLV
jgi:hypothetical protein